MHIHEHMHTDTKGHTYYTHTYTHTGTLVDNTRLTVVQLNGPTLYGSISSQSFSQSLEKTHTGTGTATGTECLRQRGVPIVCPKLSKVCERV